MRALLLLVSLLMGLPALSAAGLVCWKDAPALRCDIIADDWDIETERRYLEDQEARAAALALSLFVPVPPLDPVTAGPLMPPAGSRPSGEHYDCHVAEVTSTGIPAVTCTP